LKQSAVTAKIANVKTANAIARAVIKNARKIANAKTAAASPKRLWFVRKPRPPRQIVIKRLGREHPVLNTVVYGS
jgi:hypothetical protein